MIFVLVFSDETFIQSNKLFRAIPRYGFPVHKALVSQNVWPDDPNTHHALIIRQIRFPDYSRFSYRLYKDVLGVCISTTTGSKHN